MTVSTVRTTIDPTALLRRASYAVSRLELPRARAGASIAPEHAGAAAVATALAGRRHLWARHARFDPNGPVDVPVWHDDRWEATLGAWLPGQSTGARAHLHRPGALLVLQGELEESTWLVATDGPQPGRRHAVVRRYAAGSLRSHGTVHVHDLRNAGTDPALALHIHERA